MRTVASAPRFGVHAWDSERFGPPKDRSVVYAPHLFFAYLPSRTDAGIRPDFNGFKRNAAAASWYIPLD